MIRIRQVLRKRCKCDVERLHSLNSVGMIYYSQGRRGPLASTEVDRSIMLETRTRTEEDKEEIRASASSPDLVKVINSG